MRFVGIDYSITSPGICVGTSAKDYHLYGFWKKEYSSPKITLFKYPPWKNNMERYHLLSSKVLDLIQEGDIISIEGYSYGSSKGLQYNIGENGGILKHRIFMKYGIILTEYAPTEIKKFATGTGNSNKESMVDSYEKDTNHMIREEFGINKVGSPISDLVDSYWIFKKSLCFSKP